MRIDYPSSVPPGSFAQAINIPVHAGSSFESSARAVHDYVAFELEPTGFFAATCRVEVRAGGLREEGSVSFEVGDYDKKYIQFAEFPQEDAPSGAEESWPTIQYVVSVANANEGTGAHLSMTAYAG